MSSLAPSWVTEAPEGQKCQRCEGKEDVFALKLVFDVPSYLCCDCLMEATDVAVRAVEAGIE